MDQIQAIQGKSQFWRLLPLNDGLEAIRQYKTPLQIHPRPLLTQDNLDWASTSDGEFFYKLIESECLDGDLSLELIVTHDDELLWMKMIMMITDIVMNEIQDLSLISTSIKPFGAATVCMFHFLSRAKCTSTRTNKYAINSFCLSDCWCQ